MEPWFLRYEAATNQEVGQMSLYWLATSGQPWAEIWKEHRNIKNCYYPGRIFSVAREEDVRVLLVLIQKFGKPGSIQREGTEPIKVGLCVPEGLPIRRGVGQSPDEETGTGVKSREKKKPCRGIWWAPNCQVGQTVAEQGGGKVLNPECPDSELPWIHDISRD